MCASTELKVHVLPFCNWPKGFYGSVVRKCIRRPFTSQGWTLVLLLVSSQKKKLKLTHPETLAAKEAHYLSLLQGGNDWSQNRLQVICILTLFLELREPLMEETLPGVPEGAQLHIDTLSRPVQTLRVKMVLLGSSGVGKSSLALQFGKNEFRSTSPTVGCKWALDSVWKIACSASCWELL